LGIFKRIVNVVPDACAALEAELQKLKYLSKMDPRNIVHTKNSIVHIAAHSYVAASQMPKFTMILAKW
jgi:chorismate-pyruvate lyase